MQAGVLPETDRRTFFEDKNKKRRWNNGFRELGVPGPPEHRCDVRGSEADC